jgi:hypothetical protein
VLKGVKLIYRYDPPAKREYRKVDEDDKPFLDVLEFIRLEIG